MLDTNMIRNIAIFGHGNCGKTSLAEAMLYTAGKINRLGKVDDGSSSMDYEDEEVSRGISISSSFHNYPWKKHDIFLIDTPGDDNFLNEALFASQVCDSALFTIGAVLGVKGQTVKFANIVKDKSLPTVIAVNKMDRERADFSKTLEEIKTSLPFNPVVIQLPIGAEDDFKGYVDIISEKAYLFEGDKGTVSETDIPEDLVDEVSVYRENLMEIVAETDDDLIEKFLEEGELSADDVKTGLKSGVVSGAIAPVCVCAATRNLGTAPLLDIINSYMPSPAEMKPLSATHPESGDPVEVKPSADEPFSALVFKTMADPYAGRLTIFRVFSGILKGDSFYNSSKNESERFGQLYILEGKEQKPVDSAGPGMIVAVAKLKETTTGDTLCDAANLVVFEKPEPYKPVISFAVSAKKGEEEKVFSSITKNA